MCKVQSGKVADIIYLTAVRTCPCNVSTRCEFAGSKSPLDITRTLNAAILASYKMCRGFTFLPEEAFELANFVKTRWQLSYRE